MFMLFPLTPPAGCSFSDLSPLLFSEAGVSVSFKRKLHLVVNQICIDMLPQMACTAIMSSRQRGYQKNT